MTDQWLDSGGNEIPSDWTPSSPSNDGWIDAPPCSGGSVAYLPLAGGTMTGSLILAADPAQLLEAATKEYVDNHIPTGLVTEAPNDGQLYGRQSLGWHSVPASLADAPNDGNAYLRASGAWSSGGTLTGDTTVRGILTATGGGLNFSDANGQFPGYQASLGLSTTPAYGEGVSSVTIFGYFADTGCGWVIDIPNADPRSGGNTGANFSITAQDDTGASILPAALFINRATSTATFGGPVVLHADPAAPLQAATKRYVDAAVTAGGGFVDAPNDGTAYARRSLAWAHLTHSDITDWAASMPAAYALPTASTTVLGGVKVDGSTITIAGGVISGAPDAPNDGTAYARKSAAWAHLSHNDIADWNLAVVANYLPLGGGTMLGNLILNADPTAALMAATKQYADKMLPLAGGTVTGLLTVNNNLINNGEITNAVTVTGPATTNRPILLATGPLSLSPTNRWGIFADSAAESGSNAGSNFAVKSYTDAGALLATPLTINRASGAVAMTGTNTNDSAAAGAVGEVISSVVLTPGTTLTTNTAANVTSISLTAGDWDVFGEVWIACGATAPTALSAGINSASATMPAAPAVGVSRTTLVATSISASQVDVLALSPCRVSISTTTTIYLVAQATFGGGTTTAYGKIWARRAR